MKKSADFLLTFKKQGIIIDLIGEISSEIGTTFPSRFDDDNKGAFVLGYYQQRAAFRKFYTADKQSDVQADTNISSEVEDYE